MKIILTESQLEMLRLIKEIEDAISKFEARLNLITKQLNNVYNKIMFINISELLNNEPDVSELLKFVEQLDESNFNINSEMTKYFKSINKSLYKEKFEAIHSNLEKIYYNNSDKMNVISTILMNLEDLVNSSAKNKYRDVFSDIKDINIG
jgi:predicted component of type VI protein secretion system